MVDSAATAYLNWQPCHYLTESSFNSSPCRNTRSLHMQPNISCAVKGRTHAVGPARTPSHCNTVLRQTCGGGTCGYASWALPGKRGSAVDSNNFYMLLCCHLVEPLARPCKCAEYCANDTGKHVHTRGCIMPEASQNVQCLPEFPHSCIIECSGARPLQGPPVPGGNA